MIIFTIAAAAIFLLISTYIYLIAPSKSCKMNAFCRWFYAHRGLHKLEEGIAENTMPAFEKAVAGQYGIELDIHLSKDHQVIVFHDDTLKRACNIDKKVSELTYDELRGCKLFGTDQHIPLLADVLKTVSGKVPLIIELKSCRKLKKLCLSASSLLMEYNGLFCIESFDPRIVKWFRINRPQIIRGQLSSALLKEPNDLSFPTAFAISNLLTNFMSRPQFIAYKYQNRKNISFLICKKLFGANTAAWTIKSKHELQNAKELYDMFIFEDFIP